MLHLVGSPRSAAEALAAWYSGDLLIAQTEVMDLDETLYREGEWVVKMYAEAMSPGSPRWMQGSKQRIERISENEIIEALDYFDEKKFNYIRKKTLDVGNEGIRDLESTLEKIEVTFLVTISIRISPKVKRH